MLKTAVWAICAVLVGCQTIQESNLETLKDRADKLKALNSFVPRTCQLATTLTQPALSRYRQMFPEEDARLTTQPWRYEWEVTQVNCHIKPKPVHELSALEKNHLTIMEVAFCMLLQTHFVNSPFAGLNIRPDDVENSGSQVHLAVSPDRALGIFLDKETFNLETRTKTRGSLSATYASQNGEWLPVLLENVRGKTRLRLSEIKYDEQVLAPFARRNIKEFWISIGENQVYKQTHVELSDCVKP